MIDSGRVADPGELYQDTDPGEKPDPDPTVKNNPDSYPDPI